jgi:Na+-translocating ferredoxin:NAD+ oxidoreductase RnfE subunit
LYSVWLLHKGWTFKEEDYKYIQDDMSSINSIVGELMRMAPLLSVSTIKIIYLGTGIISIFLSLFVNYIIYAFLFPISSWFAIIIVLLITSISFPLGIKFRKQAEPSDEEIDRH